jgi:hypothetical protein
VAWISRQLLAFSLHVVDVKLGSYLQHTDWSFYAAGCYHLQPLSSINLLAASQVYGTGLQASLHEQDCRQLIGGMANGSDNAPLCKDLMENSLGASGSATEALQGVLSQQLHDPGHDCGHGCEHGQPSLFDQVLPCRWCYSGAQLEPGSAVFCGMLFHTRSRQMFVPVRCT